MYTAEKVFCNALVETAVLAVTNVTITIVTVPPLVVLVQLDDRPGLVVDHPRKAAVCLVCLELSIGIKTDTLKQQCS